MKTFFLSMAGAFVALILFYFLIFVMLAGLISSAGTSDKQSKNLVLTLDLRGQMTDQAPATGFAAFNGETGFIDIMAKLRAAETDDTVKGIFIRASDMGVGSSRAEELRAALIRLRENDKFVIAHTQGSFALGPSVLRSISAADEIWMQPGTDMMVSGLSYETMFLKGLFDNLSIESEIEAFYEFKNSPSVYSETTYTDAHREAMTVLVSSIWNISLEDIAEDRGLSVGALRAALESGPKSADEALSLNIVDKLGWPEEAVEAAEEKAGGGDLLDLASYEPPLAKPRSPVIGIVGGEGAIVMGSGQGGPFDAPGFGSDRVAAAILEAGRDDRVKAIVFRVDSPGGSPTASDQVWRAVERVQDMGKPVVVSMGSLAASGGYYVSTGADKIVANRTTITGSIGIFGGKFAVADGLRKIGINPQTISVGGEFASAFGTERFTDSQRQVLHDSLKRGYDRFTSTVAEGRGMTVAAVHEVARGRVWSGQDALEIGLVDEIGGFNDAVDVAMELLGEETGTKPRLIHFPAQKQGFEALEAIFGASAETAEAASRINNIMSDPQIAAILSELEAAQSGHIQARVPLMIEN